VNLGTDAVLRYSCAMISTDAIAIAVLTAPAARLASVVPGALLRLLP